ncbi:DUF1240 domain-containing protein [Rahnella laticis]|uniref:DUF1240 domain-containing protein n=1 Tax=Rahnella laticis TaxID=2787622 RepID=UPI0018A32132|nr:DUF1240 domain-containing protein [Rahnella laticis]MBF7994894.1 DUF1240 domain-containing protein [Rahnella laticis]
MKDNDLQKLVLYKISAFLMMAICVVTIYVISIYVDLFGVCSLFLRGDIIQYNGKVIISIGGVPLFIWMFFFSLRILLRKGMKPLKKATVIGNIWLGFSIASCCLGFVMSFIIPFILMFSSYTSCNTDKLGSYYVIHPDLCRTIVPHDKLR